MEKFEPLKYITNKIEHTLPIDKRNPLSIYSFADLKAMLKYLGTKTQNAEIVDIIYNIEQEMDRRIGL